MRFVLEVNFDTETMQLKPREELQEILRHWAKNLELYPMEAGARRTCSIRITKPWGSGPSSTNSVESGRF